MKQWPLRIQQVVIYGAFAVILVTKGHLDSFLDNSTALAKGAGMLAVAVVGLLLTQRLIRRPWIREGVRLVPILLVSALVLAPAVNDKRVDEALPVAVEVPSTTIRAPAVTATTATTATTVVTKAIPTTTVTPAPPPGRAATLAGIGHRASGRAAVYALADGSHTVRLENFSVENGPDYHVYVVPGLNKRSPAGGTHLDALKGSSGNQNYPVPAGVDIDGPYTVLIWCRAFSVPVANASLP